jgi:hypothetical protein
MLTTCMTSLLPTKASPCFLADERGPLYTLSRITVHCWNGDLGLERRQIAPSVLVEVVLDQRKNVTEV